MCNVAYDDWQEEMVDAMEAAQGTEKNPVEGFCARCKRPIYQHETDYLQNVGFNSDGEMLCQECKDERHEEILNLGFAELLKCLDEIFEGNEKGFSIEHEGCLALEYAGTPGEVKQAKELLDLRGERYIDYGDGIMIFVVPCAQAYGGARLELMEA